MGNPDRLLMFSGIACFMLSIFQVAIGFSPPLSLYFGAPEFLVENSIALIIVSIIIGAILAVFGLYAISGSGKIITLPWLKQMLLMIAIVFFLRGLVLIPELLVIFHVIKSSFTIPVRFIYFSLGSLFIGCAFLMGTLGKWLSFSSRSVNM
jgi:hypothetical protein